MLIEKEPKKENKEVPIFSVACDIHGFLGMSTSRSNLGFMIIAHQMRYGCTDQMIKTIYTGKDVYFGLDA